MDSKIIAVRLRAFVGGLCLLSFSSQHALSQMPRPEDREVMSGSCIATSHTAEGRLGSDLTKRQSRYFCDTAAITFFPDAPNHIMISFAERRSHSKVILAFAGWLDADGIMVRVDRAYFDSGVATPVDDSGCKFFFSGKKLIGIFCMAKADQEERRRVAIIGFDLKPPR